MNTRIPQSISRRVPFKAFLTGTTTPATGLDGAILITISKNGVAFGNVGGGPKYAVETGLGWYYIDLVVADTGTQGPLIVRGTHANIDPAEVVFDVVAEDEFASLVAQGNAVWAKVIGDEGQSAEDLLWDMDEEVDVIKSIVQAIGSAGGALTSVEIDADNTGGAFSGVTNTITFKGTQTGTYADAITHNGNYHTIANDNNNIDIVYRFVIGSDSQPVAIVWTGHLYGAGKTGTVEAWNFVTNEWDIISTLTGQSGSGDIVLNLVLFAANAGTVPAELGKVYIRFSALGQDTAVLYTDQLYLTYTITSRSVGYAEGAVWVDTVSGSAGTEDYVNGTADNPCLTFADASTIAASVGLRRFRVLNGSLISLNGDFTHYSFVGKNWSLLLNNQTTHGLYVDGATVLGVAGGAAPDPGQQDVARFENCVIASCTLKNCMLVNCMFIGTFTTSADALVTIRGGIDALPGTTNNPTFNIASGVELGVRDWHGGIQIEGLSTGSQFAIDGFGRLVIGSTCSGGGIVVRGPFKLTDSVVGGFLGTISDTERQGEDQSIATISGALSTTTLNSIFNYVVEGSTTFVQVLRGAIATLWGKVSGAPTNTIVFRDGNDTKDRIIATVDANGNRTTIVKDLD